MFLDIPGGDSRKILVCTGVFLLPVGEKDVSVKILFCSYIFSVQEQHGIFAVVFRCPVQEHPCIFCRVLSIFLDVDPGKIVVCAAVFLAG